VVIANGKDCFNQVVETYEQYLPLIEVALAGLPADQEALYRAEIDKLKNLNTYTNGEILVSGWQLNEDWTTNAGDQMGVCTYQPQSSTKASCWSVQYDSTALTLDTTTAAAFNVDAGTWASASDKSLTSSNSDFQNIKTTIN